LGCLEISGDPGVAKPAEKNVIGMTDDRLKKRNRAARELLSANQRTQIFKNSCNIILLMISGEKNLS